MWQNQNKALQSRVYTSRDNCIISDADVILNPKATWAWA